jgi:hypothetical protein
LDISKLDWTNDVVSSVIGTLMAIFLISLLGGKIATAWADRQFNRKWQRYREIAADEIENNFTTTHNTIMIYFGGYLKGIAEKEEKDITSLDYDLFVLRRDELMEGLKFIDRIFESYHFCLRESDVNRAQHFVVAAKRDVKEIEDAINLSLANFESMLSTHLQGRFVLSLPTPVYNCTRHEFMLACAIVIEKFLQKRDHSRYLYNRLYIFTGGLRKLGSAKSDARERILLAEKLPAVTEEAAQPQ